MSGVGENKVCLTIAGLDPSGGAGVIADVKTFSAFGCYAAAAITSLTFQNTQGVFGAEHQSAETVGSQIVPVFEDFEVDAVKTGMLPTEKTILKVAQLMAGNGVGNLVVDPVVRSTSGYDLIDDAALRSLIAELFPIAALVTPNIPEAERITKKEICNVDDIINAARAIRDLGARNVLIKGGHFENLDRSTDYLFIDGELTVLDAVRIRTKSTHGTGCTLSAAIAANLALGKNLVDAVKTAKRFVTEAIRSAPNIGHGHSPINQLITFDH
jgi:hydroxymethylpyrimidine kinase/phosphomethylpyrimidine kinase